MRISVKQKWLKEKRGIECSRIANSWRMVKKKRGNSLLVVQRLSERAYQDFLQSSGSSSSASCQRYQPTVKISLFKVFSVEHVWDGRGGDQSGFKGHYAF